MLGVSAKNPPVHFPALVKSGSTNVAAGRTVLPFLVSLAERPELMQPQYMRLVLGTPDNARASARPANTFIWTPADGSNIRYVLSRNTGYMAGGAQESRRLVATFKHSALRLKDVKARLGAPSRRYYDNRSHLVELYELAPGSTLTVSEPGNSFDVAEVTVSYVGPYLPATSAQDLADAAVFRLEQIDHHLRHGSNQRGLAFLQEHLIDNPEDIEAHLILADCLKSRCDVNGAIYECRRALALAQASGDEAMQKQAWKKLGTFGLATGDLPLVKGVSLSALSGNGSRPQ
ncbi:MAG: hypothetical protein JSS83_20925 [Cyanobacteria bacterium SZAS LIN-3]|nr:hypothetical protein [Cyanobacteria bacterium SZAS LIN-3]MBS2011099.1 hypothetical protein [Cyanobacteria bacterium SZAS TMP-1]